MRPAIPGLICAALLAFTAAAAPGRAQERKPAVREIAAVRDCAAKYKDNLDDGERHCLFSLVAQPCIDRKGAGGTDSNATDCYRLEAAIWDQLLNDNYQALLATLDAEQISKARAMQSAWIAYRDTTCQFYDDKIQGSMAISMHAACDARETARRAMLLAFFSRL